MMMSIDEHLPLRRGTNLVSNLNMGKDVAVYAAELPFYRFVFRLLIYLC